MITFPEQVTYRKYNSQPEELSPGFFVSRSDAVMMYEVSTSLLADELVGEKFMIVTAGKTLDSETLEERWTVTLMNENKETFTLMSKSIWWEETIQVNSSHEHISGVWEH